MITRAGRSRRWILQLQRLVPLLLGRLHTRQARMTATIIGGIITVITDTAAVAR